MQIAAAILIENQKVFICQRADAGNCANLWEFPGGKLETGETLEECVARECEEELGIRIQVIRQLAVSTYQYPDRKVEITFFLAERMQGEPEIRVHQQIQWVTASQLPGYDFCPADRDLVAQLSKNLPL